MHSIRNYNLFMYFLRLIYNNPLSYQFTLCNLQDFSSATASLKMEYGRLIPFMDGI